MTGAEVRAGRERRGWQQEELAERQLWAGTLLDGLEDDPEAGDEVTVGHDPEPIAHPHKRRSLDR